jgi:hypothetical protein
MVLQLTGRGAGQIGSVVEFAVDQQPGIAGDLGAEEAEPEAAVESGSKGLGWAVTHEDPPSFSFMRSWIGKSIAATPGMRDALSLE